MNHSYMMQKEEQEQDYHKRKNKITHIWCKSKLVHLCKDEEIHKTFIDIHLRRVHSNGAHTKNTLGSPDQCLKQIYRSECFSLHIPRLSCQQ